MSPSPSIAVVSCAGPQERVAGKPCTHSQIVQFCQMSCGVNHVALVSEPAPNTSSSTNTYRALRLELHKVLRPFQCWPLSRAPALARGCRGTMKGLY